jgi:hypothetical protein
MKKFLVAMGLVAFAVVGGDDSSKKLVLLVKIDLRV